ncbi:MAG: nitroreductase family protein [Bacteroides sp.]|nr:nitroreductase family protein [Bacteroides sp.]
MSRSFKEAIQHRRSYYSIGKESPVSESTAEEIIAYAAQHIPSAFNSQSARVVLLIGEHHDKLWSIVRETLRKITPEEAFRRTEQKIDTSFAPGYGTILFFEDQAVVKKFQQDYPTYANRFREWSHQSSGMLQFTIWTMLENVGFGASLQHYNPLIDEEVHKNWNIPESWELLAEMPFSTPVEESGAKEFQPIEERVKIYR